MYGGASEDGPLGDAWLFDSERLIWERTANSGFGGFPGAAKAWHTAAVLDYTEVHSSQQLCTLPHSTGHAGTHLPSCKWCKTGQLPWAAVSRLVEISGDVMPSVSMLIMIMLFLHESTAATTERELQGLLGLV